MRDYSESPRLFGKFMKDQRVFVGEVRGSRVIELGASCMMDLIRDGTGGLGSDHSLDSLKTLAPVDKPSKIICIGLNYKSHIHEMQQKEPENPIIFTKPSSAIIGPEDEITLPDMSSRVDFEGEAAIVIGERAKRSDAGLDHVFGYTCFNDVTARDLQKTDPDWTRSKGFDTFAPIGPYISTAPPTRVMTRLNGRTVQDALLSDRVFDDETLVVYISRIMTLDPGDIIATGTPSGIAPMKPGDIVEVEVDTVGRLRNSVISK